MIKQTILLKFKEGTHKDEERQLLDWLLSQKDRIPEVLDSFERINCVELNLNKGFTHFVGMTFRDEAAYVRYLTHPVQHELSELLKALVDDLIIVNFKENAPEQIL